MNEEIIDNKTKVICPECGFENLLYDCETETTVCSIGDDDYIEVVEYSCQKCGFVISRKEYEPDLGVGPQYGDYDPAHALWDSGDYGDYSGGD